MIDGRSRGYVIESCTSDIVMLRATLRSAQAHVLSFDPGTNILEVKCRACVRSSIVASGSR